MQINKRKTQMTAADRDLKRGRPQSTHVSFTRDEMRFPWPSLQMIPD